MLMVAVVVCACAAAGGNGAGPVSVAVWNPEPIGPMTDTQMAMAEIIAARVLNQFSQSPRYEVVERQSLLKVLEEQNLGTSGLTDDQTRLELGRIIGCRQMVFGAYQIIGNTMRLDIRTVDVSSSRVIKTAVATASANAVGNWMNAADKAAAELVSSR